MYFYNWSETYKSNVLDDQIFIDRYIKYDETADFTDEIFPRLANQNCRNSRVMLEYSLREDVIAFSTIQK